jgi:hypothetical protein
MEMPGYSIKAELDSLDAQIERRIKAEAAVGEFCEWRSSGWSYTSGCGVAGNLSFNVSISLRRVKKMRLFTVPIEIFK